MTVFAEEKGLLGSRYYARHPLFPLEKTVANINLEVLGRTDGPEGGYKNKAGMTGFEYSNLGESLCKGRPARWRGGLPASDLQRRLLSTQ